MLLVLIPNRCSCFSLWLLLHKQGLKELHSRNVVHGDLNARNVLLSSSGVTALGVVAKLADLGLSRIVRSHKSHHSTNTVGTMSHVAPGGYGPWVLQTLVSGFGLGQVLQ